MTYHPSGRPDLGSAEQLKIKILGAMLAKNTQDQYRSAWKHFAEWCAWAHKPMLPSNHEVLLDFAAWCICQGYRISTVRLRLGAIFYYHRQAGLAIVETKPIRLFLRNARRTLCQRERGKDSITPEQLRQISEILLPSKNPMDIRDRSILLLCFALGWRCSEIVSLNLTDLQWKKEGIIVYLGKSKTDQEGKGRLVGVQHGDSEITCPLRALDAWLEIRGREDGPLYWQVGGGFRHDLISRRLSPDAVRRVVKRCLDRAGIDSVPFGAHSLRAGMVTAAVIAGASEAAIMQRTGHTSHETLRRYIRPAMVFQLNPLRGVL